MEFQVGDKVRFLKPLQVGNIPDPTAPNGLKKDIREGLVGRVQPHHPNPSEKVAHLVPVRFFESNLLWYLNPDDLEKVD